MALAVVCQLNGPAAFLCARTLKSCVHAQGGTASEDLLVGDYYHIYNVRSILVHFSVRWTNQDGGLGYIPSSVMIPQRRISTLLNQAFAHQREHCVYHNSAPPSSQPLASSSRRKEYSLYMDHVCEPDVFPRVTTMILEGHHDEVWNLQWSHSGLYLATCGKDARVLIWKIGVGCCPSMIKLYF